MPQSGTLKEIGFEGPQGTFIVLKSSSLWSWSIRKSQLDFQTTNTIFRRRVASATDSSSLEIVYVVVLSPISTFEKEKKAK